jgi:hypothetical protein
MGARLIVTLLACVSWLLPVSVAAAQPSDIGEGPARRQTTRTIRVGDPNAIGLPAGTRVNAEIFKDVHLNNEQVRGVVALAASFAAEMEALLKNQPRGKVSADLRERLEPFVERQRLAYRSLLTEAQQGIYDGNVRRVLAGSGTVNHLVPSRAKEGR